MDKVKVRGEGEDRMSAPQAVAILMEMMRDKTLGVDSINAISMGVVKIMHNYRSRMRNYARRYAAAGKTITDGSEVAK